MRKFVCTICGYVYDEAKEKLKWDELPDDWKCPLCGASKGMFKEQKPEPASVPKEKEPIAAPETIKEEMKELSNGELAALCSNLAKGCEKQYLPEQAALFTQLAEYYTERTVAVPENSFADLLKKIEEDLEVGFVQANRDAAQNQDRGAKRALTWSEKVTRMGNSLLAQYEKEGEALAENTNVFVCDICGFIYIGDEPPEICPVCKVPALKILKVERR